MSSDSEPKSFLANLFASAKEIIVSTPEVKPTEGPYVRPAHHENDSRTRFKNPWPSFRFPTSFDLLQVVPSMLFSPPPIPANISTLIPVHRPTWGVNLKRSDVKATWLGHACFLVEFPTPKYAVRGPRVIFDPALSDRCSPVQFMGPKRFTPVPCKIEEIPSVDAIVLSHNHYDHTDTHSLKTLFRKHKPHVFAPLGIDTYLSSIGIPSSHIHTLDWWEHRNLTLSLPTDASNNGTDVKADTATSSSTSSIPTHVDAKLKITCTPAQHLGNRGPFDRWKTLWSSWAVEEVVEPSSSTSSSPPPKKVFFAGDTGYSCVPPERLAELSQDAVEVMESKLEICPAFKEVGEKLGPFDFAMIPIGAYDPRVVFSGMHAHPADSVRIFKDIKAKKALGMHWGTWTLTMEPIMEPPQELRKQCERLGVPTEDFGVCDLGETLAF